VLCRKANLLSQLENLIFAENFLGLTRSGLQLGGPGQYTLERATIQP